MKSWWIVHCMSMYGVPHLTTCWSGTAGFARFRSRVAVCGLPLPLPKVAEFLIPALHIERQRNYKRDYRRRHAICETTVRVYKQQQQKKKQQQKNPKTVAVSTALACVGFERWNVGLLVKVTLNRETISWLSCSLCE